MGGWVEERSGEADALEVAHFADIGPRSDDGKADPEAVDDAAEHRDDLVPE